jgi:DNA polymerase III delta prime subunit
MISTNLNMILNEIDWLEQVIHQVITTYLMQEGHENSWLDLQIPELDEESDYSKKVREWNLNQYERLAMALAMAPHVKPNALDIFYGKNGMYDRPFTEFGGALDRGHSGFIPTGQTYIFILTSNFPELWRETIEVLNPENILFKEGVLQVSNVDSLSPKFNGVLSIAQEWMHFFLTGKEPLMEHNHLFPAKRISTSMKWEDAVLNDQVLDQIEELKTWVNHSGVLMEDWGLQKHLKPGYRALFHGPPGTGKTLTATLIGQETQREVYRIDLSMIVSKYIGETEKNLARLFDLAQDKNWILFFDEADALFSRRTEAKTSNDQHANQQAAYLLQRIEDFPGIVILATNLKSNIDEAFSRRFQAMIHFDIPDVEERLQLWQNAFSGKLQLDVSIDMWELAENYELAGGTIINVLRYCAIAALQSESTIVSKEQLMEGIRREFRKESKTVKMLN